ncbi:MAG TPA: hypothetical protein VJV79_14400 [Polyangiaceae bacterium]|nr:hypothetical protein [Polyangiaceae bacterium]
MKIIPFSLCIGLTSLTSLALLGPLACAGSKENASTIGSAGSGTPPIVSGSGGAGTVTYAGGGGTGSVDIFTPTGGAPPAAGNQCSPGNTTKISGIVRDPAGKNPLYNISVFVLDPASPLPDLEKIPVSCGCAQLLPEKVLAIGAPTDASGHFEIPCAPSGPVTLVVQTGKWRRKYENVNVVANQDNVITDLRLPANSSEGSLPNIAISTGGSDSFECLPLRIGVSASEYVAGSATGGHIHIYSGLRGATPAQGAVDSYKALWDSQAHLNEHDVVILSCEGAETSNGPISAMGGPRPGQAQSGPPLTETEQNYLVNYVNGGGRVFASHYQYAWFSSGPFNTGANRLATWGPGTIGTGPGADTDAEYMAEINTTLSTNAPFPGGTALATWLGIVGALRNNQLPVRYVRNNASMLRQPPATEWIHLAADVSNAASAPQYFSADTPIGAPDGKVCGRVVYSALHVSGGPGKSPTALAKDADYPAAPADGAAGGRGMMTGGQAPAGIAPSGCAIRELTPQEKALEFMFFDLSSCLVPIGEEPPVIPK